MSTTISRSGNNTLSHDLEETLRLHFGFDQFLPGQRKVIEHLVAGNSAAAVFPTGGGKSICYQLPALLFSGVTLVVSPLIALMKDQIDALQAKDIPAVRIDSTLTLEQYRSAVDRLRAGELRLIYVAPERFNNERFRAMIRQTEISLFAIDEAHCISEWGHAFRPDYLKLARYAEQCGAERCLALTATAPPKVLDDICREFEIQPNCATRTGFYRPNLTLRTAPVPANERDQTLVDRIRSRDKGATIVYVTLQKTAQQVSKTLTEAGIEARPYHAGMKPELRAETQEWFLEADAAVIVATIAFGMGIDKSDIRYVYHYNLAKSLENYSQEIGRAGRDGAESICETLVCLDDLRALENFAYGDTPTLESLRSFVDDLFAKPEAFSISLYDLQQQHNIRELVLKTLLTYLELDGLLESGTPIYGEYKFKPLRSSAEILGNFVGERREFVSKLLSKARQAKTWFHLDIDATVRELRSDRSRVVRAMDYLAERGWLDLRTSKVQHRFTRLRQPDSLQQLAEDLHQRCERRQDQELNRLHQTMELMALDACQTNALAAHFGEIRDEPCGHCNWCLEQTAAELIQPEELSIDQSAWDEAEKLRQKNLQDLGDAVSFARFLCGLRTPKLTKAKLTRHEQFGKFSDCSFADVLAKTSIE